MSTERALRAQEDPVPRARTRAARNPAKKKEKGKQKRPRSQERERGSLSDASGDQRKSLPMS
ncbi:hypothetical protein GCM10011512_11480 [Tersicoccus solisilvae]|uniref:Uncharacterized protein n=1 Tax=Tersicoccus solisilvae TaxID=1882339 RepID=A0ABQ1NXU6_9MICC|nr:hypothetical protein GCM10011512_11480 [Tersicoccus solisilvae]